MELTTFSHRTHATRETLRFSQKKDQMRQISFLKISSVSMFCVWCETGFICCFSKRNLILEEASKDLPASLLVCSESTGLMQKRVSSVFFLNAFEDSIKFHQIFDLFHTQNISVCVGLQKRLNSFRNGLFSGCRQEENIL